MSILCLMDQGDWKEMCLSWSLFELEKGDMVVERFAFSAGPLGWKLQGVRVFNNSNFKGQEIPLKTVRFLSLGVFQQGLKSHLPEMLLNGSLLRWQDWGSFQVFTNLKTSSFILCVMRGVPRFREFCPCSVLTFPGVRKQHFHPLSNPFFLLGWAFVVV